MEGEALDFGDSTGLTAPNEADQTIQPQDNGTGMLTSCNPAPSH